MSLGDRFNLSRKVRQGDHARPKHPDAVLSPNKNQVLHCTGQDTPVLTLSSSVSKCLQLAHTHPTMFCVHLVNEVLKFARCQ